MRSSAKPAIMAVAADAWKDTDCLIASDANTMALVTQFRLMIARQSSFSSFASHRNHRNPRLARIKVRPMLRVHVAKRPSLVYSEKWLLEICCVGRPGRSRSIGSSGQIDVEADIVNKDALNGQDLQSVHASG